MYNIGNLKIRLAIGAVIFCTLSIFSCNFHNRTKVDNSSNRGSNLALNAKAASALISKLQNGDVIIRRGRGPISDLLARLNLKDQSWSHCGIVLIENGYPFVYHSIGGEDNPDERLRKDSAVFFCNATNNSAVAIVRYQTDTGCSRIISGIVREWYRKRPKFDMDFLLETDDKLYCSEFIYKALVRATGDTLFIPKSYGHGRLFIGIDDLFLNPHARLVAKVNYK